MFFKTGAEKRSDKLHKRGGVTAVGMVLEYEKGFAYTAGGPGGTSAGNVAHYGLKVRVEPDGEAPFEASVKATNVDGVNILKAPNGFGVVPKPGDTIAVIYDPGDHSKIAADLSPSPEFVQQHGDPSPAASPPATNPGGADPVEKLKELADLRDRGVVSESEFQEQKRKLLGEP